jgi:hypothetical protein
VLAVGVADYADGLYPVDALSTCDELPPHLRHTGAPSRTSVPPATVWTLLDEATAIFVGGAVEPTGAAAEQLHRDFRQIRAYPAFRLLVRK